MKNNIAVLHPCPAKNRKISAEIAVYKIKNFDADYEQEFAVNQKNIFYSNQKDIGADLRLL